MGRCIARTGVPSSHSIVRKTRGPELSKTTTVRAIFEPNVKLIPKNIDQVREVLFDLPANLEIGLEIGVPLDAKTVEDLRLLSTWPHGLGLTCNREGFLMRVTIERARP